MRLQIVTGNGRVMRTGECVAFSTELVQGLYELLKASEEEGSDVFKALAALVLQAEFKLAPFVVLSTGPKRTVFAFGDATLSCASGRTVSGTNTSTWVEAELAEDEWKAGTIGAAASAADGGDTELVLGNVLGGGLMWSADNDNIAPRVSPKPTSSLSKKPPKIPKPSNSSRSSSEPVNVTAPKSSQPEPEPVSVKPKQGGGPMPPPPKASDLISASYESGELSTSETVEPSAVFKIDGLDPQPQEVEDVDSHFEAGEANSVASMAQTAPLALPTELASESAAEVKDPLGYEFTDEELGDAPLSVEKLAFEAKAETIPSLEPRQFSTSEVRDAGSLYLRLDDGHAIEITQSVYVGRFPQKGERPDGYGVLAVNGEHVSRQHWELIVEGSKLFVRDLGSTGGTQIQSPGDDFLTSVPTDFKFPVKPGTTVHFSDRSAIVEIGAESA